ncbi:MAG: sel1 repeat family protein [Polyangiaceae bacterium]|nr:sel1 repeat family protein [Polyangiaceae bacterium]
MALTTDDEDFLLAEAQYQGFVRGDALIGLVADVPEAERAMMNALWAAAGRGCLPAYRTIGDCYMAVLKPVGAFEGISPDDADARPWSSEAQAIVDPEIPALQAALRGYFEAARAGDREAAMHYARMSRHSSRENQERALALLLQNQDPTAAELYQRGLVQNWLSDLEASAATHRAAAERGNLDAQFELYIYYAQGLGVEADPEKSQAWLHRAAEGDHPRALYNIAAAYASGSEGEKDLKKAASYYERAAAHGNGRAAATLGVMILTEEIEGTREQAIRWLDMADEYGYATWEMLDAVDLDDPREPAD